MPYVNIKITPEGATAEKKAELIAGVTSLLQTTLGKNPSTTHVVIDVVETEARVDATGDYVETLAVLREAEGGVPVDEFRRQQAKTG